jgi:hypothetical protein
VYVFSLVVVGVNCCGRTRILKRVGRTTAKKERKRRFERLTPIQPFIDSLNCYIYEVIVFIIAEWYLFAI